METLNNPCKWVELSRFIRGQAVDLPQGVKRMEYVYATLLLHSAKKEISEDSLRKVLEAAGIAVDDIRLKSFVAAVKEINIDDVLKTSLAMPVTPVATTSTATPVAQAPQPSAEKKEEEEKKEAVSEEQLAEGLAALFG
ncbi:MAG: 50S ribosomal protein P1 [Ignisphaera sp.]